MHESTSTLVVITTGRPGYRQAAESLRLNIERWNPAVSRIDLLINYDVGFESAGAAAFTDPPPRPLAAGGCVHFAGPDFVRGAGWLDAAERPALESISPATGYGQKKNACLLFAVRHGYGRVLFWDDDEYALHMERVADTVRWTSTDVISAHALARADVSFGFCTGYISPIPDSLFLELDRNTRATLTEALQPINDAVNESTFFERSASFHVARAGEGTVAEVPETRGGKWISGGNVGLRCAAIAAGRLPAFYTPTDSRGDDSVFSTGLCDAVVMRTPAGIFHDAFGALAGADLSRPAGLPVQLPAPGRNEERFARVLRGRLAYAPVLAVLRGVSDVAGTIGESASRLAACEQALAVYFGSAWKWPPPSELLRGYLASVDTELEAYRQTQRTWRQLCGT
ncbi:MAG TPA: hypothetical protein VFJ16_28400 [Longimicrobium sp.]|nr:hypothetical protein [Longimicrobium sp.]